MQENDGAAGDRAVSPWVGWWALECRAAPVRERSLGEMLGETERLPEMVSCIWRSCGSTAPRSGFEGRGWSLLLY